MFDSQEQHVDGEIQTLEFVYFLWFIQQGRQVRELQVTHGAESGHEQVVLGRDPALVQTRL